MNLNRKLNISQEQEVINLYLSGLGAKKICKLYGVSVTPIYKILEENGIKRRNKEQARREYYSDSSYFDEIDSPAKAYILGLFFTDGNNYLKARRIAIGMNDLEVVEFIKKELKSTNKIYKVKKRKNCKNHYRLDIRDKKLSDSLSKLGCIPKKSKVVRFPTKESVPEYLIKYFVLGCFDGDGGICRYRPNGYIFHYIGTEDMCRGIYNFILKELGIKITFNKVYKSSFLHHLRCSSKENVFKILSFLYEKTPFKMKRKFDIFSTIK